MDQQQHAANALADVRRTEQKLSQRTRWPFHRHAMFGLAEGLIVAGVAQPTAISGAMTAGAMALIVACVVEDRRKRGMFVSGWRTGATLPLTVVLSLFLGVMLIVSVSLRDGTSLQPLGFVAGLFTFIVATFASLRWEKLYCAEGASGGRP